MIEVTEKAIEKISGIIENDDNYSSETTLFRIQVTGKTATDYKYGIGLEFRKDDYATTESFFDLEKFSMIVDERSLRVLEGATVDYKEDLNVQGFDIINPNKPEASDLEERIMELIDSTVNPQIASHGGRDLKGVKRNLNLIIHIFFTYIIQIILIDSHHMPVPLSTMFKIQCPSSI